MREMLQMSQKDLEFLALMVQVWGLIATVALTFMFRRRVWAWCIGPVLMLGVNVASRGPSWAVGRRWPLVSSYFLSTAGSPRERR